MFSITAVDLVLFFGFFGSIVYWYLTKTFDYWKKRNVIYETPYPVFGTSASQILMRESPNTLFQRIYQKYPNEDFVGGFVSNTPLLIVKNPELIKHILVKDFNHFRDRNKDLSIKGHPSSQTLFQTTGDTWKALRQKLTPVFTSGKLRNGFPLLSECAKEFQNYLQDVLEEGKEIEIKDLMAKFTTDVIGSYAFGIKMNSMKDENAPFRVMGTKVFNITRLKAILIAASQLMPSLIKILRSNSKKNEVDTFFVDLFKSVVESRDNKPSTRNDFVDLLIELKTKGHVKGDVALLDESGNNNSIIEMSDELLTAQAFIFFLAGFETSSTAMSFTLYELAQNMPVQQKLAEEIDQVLAKHNGQLSYESMKEMTYLRMVLNESLRKYPPAGTLNRICTVPYTIPNTNIKLDEGVLLAIPTYSLHHDPKYYPEPDRFIPERFSNDEEIKRQQFVFLPFGDGPRNCIGDRFARMQSMVGLVSVLQHYTVEPNSKTVPIIKFAARSFVSNSDTGIHLKLKRRRP